MEWKLVCEIIHHIIAYQVVFEKSYRLILVQSKFPESLAVPAWGSIEIFIHSTAIMWHASYNIPLGLLSSMPSSVQPSRAHTKVEYLAATHDIVKYGSWKPVKFITSHSNVLLIPVLLLPPLQEEHCDMEVCRSEFPMWSLQSYTHHRTGSLVHPSLSRCKANRLCVSYMKRSSQQMFTSGAIHR